MAGYGLGEREIYLIFFFWNVSLSIFTSAAVFWRARKAGQNTNYE